MPFVPPMPFMASATSRRSTGDKDSIGEMKSFWEQVIDMEKSSVDSSREQWNQFFERMMDMEDSFIESMPDDMSSLPGFPFGQMPGISPKKFMKQLKKYQKMANDHLVDQADFYIDLILKGQKQFCDVVSEADDKAREKKSEYVEVDDIDSGDEPA